VCQLGERLHEVWERFRQCFKTKTRDTSENADHYLSGLLRMKAHRHFVGISREEAVDSQRLQHFMSQSPWSGAAVCHQVRQELKATAELTAGGVLLVDESADERAGDQSAGAARQYNGRLGKVEMSQVGVMQGFRRLEDSARLLELGGRGAVPATGLV
jgi:SRSO17 transposase